MATSLLFASEKERALHKIKETQRLFADYMESTKGKNVRLLRLFIYDRIPTDHRPNCYQVKLDHAQQPVQYSRPHAEFRKSCEGKQTYDQSFTQPGIYFYSNLKYWGEKNFTYQKEGSGYFQIDDEGNVKRILKSEIVSRLQEWESQQIKQEEDSQTIDNHN